NQDIGYAKSIMDYIFRWLQLRFLTGQQQALFDGLRPKYVNAPPPGVPDENGYGSGVILSDPEHREGQSKAPGAPSFAPGVGAKGGRDESASLFNSVIPGTAGAPSLSAGISGQGGKAGLTGPRGHHHASDALQDLIDMGDSPSCPVCGAIMTRNGSCYRCMSCGSTSGCS